MITRNAPDTWQSLQTEIGRILEECGFAVEVKKKIQSARGVVELDVYAEETVRGRKYAIACECKHWKSRIPQTVVHGFRTVVQEIGANIGYIVSMEGFQSGAGAASDLTNLKLVTWQEFQDIFEESWFEEFFTKQIDEKLDGLMTYAEPFLPAWFERMSDEDKAKYYSLKEKYDLYWNNHAVAWSIQPRVPKGADSHAAVACQTQARPHSQHDPGSHPGRNCIPRAI